MAQCLKSCRTASRVEEIVSILAEAYLRLLTQRRAQFRDSDVTAYQTANSATNPLAIPHPLSDVSPTGQPRNSL